MIEAAHAAIALMFFMGAALGSFLTVVIHRLPQRRGLIERSACPRCHGRIPWYRNIPILAWMLQRGRCARCGEPISVRYPLIEVAAGTIMVAALLRWGATWTAASAIVFSYLMIVLAFIDLDHRILPNVLTLPGTVLGFALSFVDPRLDWIDSLFGIALGGGALYAVAWLYLRARGREGMGMGDVKMMFLVGAFLGWQGAFMTILIGSVLGSVIGGALIALTRRGWEYALPFGTFLAAAAVAVEFYGPPLLDWYIITFVAA